MSAVSSLEVVSRYCHVGRLSDPRSPVSVIAWQLRERCPALAVSLVPLCPCKTAERYLREVTSFEDARTRSLRVTGIIVLRQDDSSTLVPELTSLYATDNKNC